MTWNCKGSERTDLLPSGLGLVFPQPYSFSFSSSQSERCGGCSGGGAQGWLNIPSLIWRYDLGLGMVRTWRSGLSFQKRSLSHVRYVPRLITPPIFWISYPDSTHIQRYELTVRNKISRNKTLVGFEPILGKANVDHEFWKRYCRSSSFVQFKTPLRHPHFTYFSVHSYQYFPDRVL